MVNPRPFLIDAGRIVFLIGISISVAVTSVVAQAGNTPGATSVADGDATVPPDLASGSCRSCGFGFWFENMSFLLRELNG
jgi:hypothetical protein